MDSYWTSRMNSIFSREADFSSYICFCTLILLKMECLACGKSNFIKSEN